MESDKELAFRFKRIYKKKLKKDDFEGAHSAFVKAASLFPEIENAGGMNALLRILSCWHCEEVNEMDWYSILGIPRDAEEDEVRNALEKLTSLVDSMKKKYPGVEIALEILDEAGYLLCDGARRSDLNTFLNAKKKAVSCRLLQELEEEIAASPTSSSGPCYDSEIMENDVPSKVSPSKRQANWGDGDAPPKKVTRRKSKDSRVSKEKSGNSHVAVVELEEYSKNKEDEPHAAGERVLGLQAEIGRLKAEIEHEKKVIKKLQSDFRRMSESLW